MIYSLQQDHTIKNTNNCHSDDTSVIDWSKDTLYFKIWNLKAPVTHLKIQIQIKI